MTERRKYIRLDSVFPVQFRLLTKDGKCFVSEWMQGFTCNISKGGICLEINNPKSDLAEKIKEPGMKLDLEIAIPLSAQPVNVQSDIIWVKEKEGQPKRYILGLNYIAMPLHHNKRIMRVAWTKRLFAPIALGIIVILGIGFALGSYLNFILIEGNRALVDQLVGIVQDSTVAKQIVKQINKDKEELEIKLHTLKNQLGAAVEERAKLSEKAELKEINTTKRLEESNRLIDKLNKDKENLQEKLIALQSKENTVSEDLMRLNRKKATLEKANLDKMYQWLKIHQSPRTGLVMSFEGDGDISNWGFTYDQSLALLAYSNFGDFSRAKKILNFFDKKAERAKGGFLNAYYVNDGKPAEYAVHSGPNIWLGIAIAQYTKMSEDTTYLKLSEEIARNIMKLQAEDTEGGLRGGWEVEWFATEHNLDAYALFNMLYALTNKKEYLASRDKILDWLLTHTYDKSDVPIKRGKGDGTIATDTYAWSIAAIGPEKLEKIGMNPERILEFAENNCAVEVDYKRPEGKSVKVKGFDFAPNRHVGRGGIVSSEWTAQMVISFRILADYYYKKGLIAKGRSYEFKADDYLSSLSNMVISSPSASGQGESCLPYATLDFVDTGHGWTTPKGRSTGSVAGTAYTLFAYYKFNPLELKQ